MNFTTYGSIYGKFHGCNVSVIRNNIIVLDLKDYPFETWLISRTLDSKKIHGQSQQPLLQALKAYFKTDAPATAFCKGTTWTVLLGNERVILPMVPQDATFHLYATPYYVTDPKILANYLQDVTRPAYDNVYPYKNTILYLDNYDQPYPSGCYFDTTSPSSYYRICFLSQASVDEIARLVNEWTSRRGVLTIPYLTKEVAVCPKLIELHPVTNPMLTDSMIVSSGIVHRQHTQPRLFIQDILASYQRNALRDVKNLGLVLEYPFHLTFDGARTPHVDQRQFVALSINSHEPDRILYVRRPYDRYMEHSYVPTTIWTFVSYVPTSLEVGQGLSKIVIDTIVIGFLYRGTFFCLGQPLLEGQPAGQNNTRGFLSVSDKDWDDRVHVIQTFRYNANYSIHRASLRGIPFETWCVSRAEKVDPSVKKLPLPFLVREWIDLLLKTDEERVLEVDPGMIRLALTLSKHKICFNLVANETETATELKDKSITFTTKKESVDFINSVRLERSKQGNNPSGCIIS